MLNLVFAGLWVGSCTKVDSYPQPSDFEKTTGPLPYFNNNLDSNGIKTIRFDSIAQGGNFSLSFTPLAFGSVRIVEEGKAVQIQMKGGNWSKDSTEYTICKNLTCRKGKIILFNLQYKKTDTIEPIDTSCSELATRKVYGPFNQLLKIGELFPFAGNGKIDSLKSQLYTVGNQGDSIITFTTLDVPVDQKWAWDTIRYKLKAKNRKCWTGKLAIVLGDTCEPEARNDIFSLPTGKALWPQNELTANDKSCNNQLGSYITRTATEFEYGNYKVMATANGILTDTLVNGSQFYKYERTNTGAVTDGFYYYFKNLTTNRVTKAWVKIIF